MKKYINGLALLLLLLSACKVSKDVETPKIAMPETFRNAAISNDTASVGDLPYKKFFNQTDLQVLIDSALTRNFDLQIAVKNLEKAQLIVKQSKWNNVPTAALNVTASSSRPSDNSINGLSLAQYNFGNHIEDYSANLAISWEADIWGKIRNQNKTALAAYLQTAEARKAVQASIVASVSQSYYNLLMLDEQLQIARRNVALNDSTLHMIRLMYDAGQVTSLAVQQSEAQRSAAAELVPQFEQDITIQENALQLLAGNLPGSIARSTRLKDISLSDSLAAGIPSAMLSRRPDVKSQEYALAIANASVGISKAQMYPALRITATGGVNSFKASDWFNVPASLFGVVAGSVFQPLLDHKQLKTRYEAAKVEREQTVIRFRQTVLTAAGEVSDALVKIEKQRSREAIAAGRLKTLQQATANANFLFKNGKANYLEVITAQSNVLQSELELAAVKRAGLSASAELYIALGGGWK